MNSKPTSDGEWIQDAVTRYEGPLTIYAARMVGDVDRARDVVQDTFLKLWQADRQHVDGHLVKWLYTVCRNRALDVRRKEHRMTTLDGKHVDAMGAPADASGDARVDDPGAGVGSRVQRLVTDLPERQQEAVRLKFQGGLSYREIAEVMDTTVNNVGVLLHTAIKSIRGQISGAHDGSDGAVAPPGKRRPEDGPDGRPGTLATR